MKRREKEEAIRRKEEADTSSNLYKYTINSGLPDGLIRGLKADLKEFKSHWRETY